MKRLALILVAACALVAGCGDDDTSGPSNAPVVFSTLLSPANEVPPIANNESIATGATQISIDTSSNTVNLYFQIIGLAAGTNLVGAHIHPGVAGVNGPVVVSTGLTAGMPLTTPSNATEFNITVAIDPALAQAIIANPSGYYFNVHTTMNPGGVARGQLVRIQ